MALVVEALGAVLWLAFAGLGLVGAGLVVALVGLALDRHRSSGVDVTRLRAGRWSQLRRYAMYWLGALVLWTVAVIAAVGLRGA